MNKPQKLQKPSKILERCQIEPWKILPGDWERAKFLYQGVKEDPTSHIFSIPSILSLLSILAASYLLAIASNWFFPAYNPGKLTFLLVALPTLAIRMRQIYDKDILRISKREDYLLWMEKITGKPL